MTTTAMTNNTSAVIDTAEADRRAALLADAKAVLFTRQSEHDEADQKHDRILDTYEEGDSDTFSADDLAAAEAGVRRARALLDAAQRNVDALTARQINTDVCVAEALAPVVLDLLRGRIPVVVQAGPAPTSIEGHNLPVVVLTQAKPSGHVGGILSTAERSGMASGGVVLTYLRDSLYTEFPADQLQKALDARGFVTNVTGASTKAGRIAYDDHAVDTLRIFVQRAWTARPEIPADPTTELVTEAATQVARSLAGHMPGERDLINTMEPTVHSLAKIEAVEHRSKVTKKVRTTEVDLTINVAPSPTTKVKPLAVIGSILDGEPGKARPHLGVCTEITHAATTKQRGDWPATNDPITVKVKATYEASTV